MTKFNDYYGVLSLLAAQSLTEEMSDLSHFEAQQQLALKRNVFVRMKGWFLTGHERGQVIFNRQPQ